MQTQTQLYHDFYEHRWSRQLIFLIYGLTLVLAGFTLFLFPLNGGSKLLQQAFWFYARFLGSWLAYDLGIVWIFTIASLFLAHVEPMLQTAGTASPFTTLERRIVPLVRWPWLSIVAGNFLIIALVGSSAGLGYYLYTTEWRLLLN